MNLSEIDSPGSSNKSNINGTIVMSVDSGSASIMGSYVYNNTISIGNSTNVAGELAKFIKLYKGFTSETDLSNLFSYNHFTITAKYVNNNFNAITPFDIIYNNSSNMVYFYYIYNADIDKDSAKFLSCDSYNISSETYTTDYWTKQIFNQ